ncbi:MAG TPA: zinc ribbon domain-containing protein [Bryobacteraceae bacterium]|nr:zinc ribbon domain-containing protein [Bryobacteraceae bacterium]
MFCDRCGTQISDQTRFCPSCGKAVGITPFMPVHSRIAGHVRLLGIFWLALSGLHLMPGLIVLSFAGHGWWFLPPGVPGFVHGILSIVGWALVGGSILGLVTGWGLLQREPWARTLAIVMGFLHLLNMPFGTALGIYTLWVLLPAASEQEYRSVARAA